jgi:hypothetical protein
LWAHDSLLFPGVYCLNVYLADGLLARFAGGFTIPELDGAFHLHDKMKEYLGDKLGRKALTAVHNALIDAWGNPHQLPDEYAWCYYGYHLDGAEQIDRLRALLLDYLWLQAKLNATEVNTLVDDCDWLPDDSAARMLRHALILSRSMLTEDRQQFASQISGRLWSQRQQTQIAGFLDNLPYAVSRPYLLPRSSVYTDSAGSSVLAVFNGHTAELNGATQLADGSIL